MSEEVEKSLVSEGEYNEIAAKSKSGFVMLSILIILSIGLLVGGVMMVVNQIDWGALLFVLFVALVLFMLHAFIIIQPNEARVLLLFGKYVGTVRNEGFYFINPFCVRAKVSVKARTLINEKQKVNDERGNPIEIGVIVIWRVIDTAKAAFKVADYDHFLSTQCDSAIRNVARQYPYDAPDDESNEKSLRGSSSEIAEVLQKDLATRVALAGIEIMDARISHLAYAPEIAAAMLQRQQAEAVVAARQKIVEGAVGMVEMALSDLSKNNIVKLDDDKKAAMVCNLMVVLCGNHDAQPIVNASSNT